MGKQWKRVRLYFWGLQNHCRWWLQPRNKRHLLLGRKVMTNLDSILKSRHYFANKGSSSQGYGFSNSHVQMWELDYKESWAPKNWCFWTVVLEKTWQSLGLQGDEPWIFTGRIDAEAPILWSPDAKNWHWKRPWCWERLKAGGEGDNRGRDGWKASPTRWTWVWVNSALSWYATAFLPLPEKKASERSSRLEVKFVPLQSHV